MPLIQYRKYRPSPDSQDLIDLSINILEEFEAQGYKLTLRQLYYQLVARDEIPNSQKSYTNLGGIISRAREAGLIDWDHIEDRTRRVSDFSHWENGEHFLEDQAARFSLDWWKGQPVRCFVFVEKEALAEVVGRAAEAWDVPWMANKGYLSSSAAWDVSHNWMLTREGGCEEYVVIHLGDHDPSGIDMTRDIKERLGLFCGKYEEDQKDIRLRIRRIALNWDQIDQYGPPPNPAKATDSRFEDYRARYGEESWELDALPPAVLDELIQENILDLVGDLELMQSVRLREAEIRQRISEMRLEETDGEA